MTKPSCDGSLEPFTERHPFEPFLPPDATVLFLGSFPPQPKRWCMDFYYPNFNNDFWRICGLIFFRDRDHFIVPGEKRFDKEAIISFSQEKGLAFFDTATEVRRLAGNASDRFLEVVTPTDLPALLARIPSCRTLVTTGQKATDVLTATYGSAELKTGTSCDLSVGERSLRLFRLPSTSRAYPLSLDKKTAAYRQLFKTIGLLDD